MVHILSDKCPWLEILAKNDFHAPLRYPINICIFREIGPAYFLCVVFSVLYWMGVQTNTSTSIQA